VSGLWGLGQGEGLTHHTRAALEPTSHPRHHAMEPTHVLPPLPVLRRRIPDSTILDAMELAAALPPRPCRICRSALEAYWQITQSALSRRLSRIQRAGLLAYEIEYRTIWVTRVGVDA
jgi:hypothetical protein